MIARALLVLAGLLIALPVVAAPLTLEWRLPTQTCDGQRLAPEDIVEIEIYISAGPIPAMDMPCPPAGSPVDEVPTSFSTIVESAASEGSATVDLIGGHTYHARARVRSADGWSNLSSELTAEVPTAAVQAPALLRFEL